jgi:hypothetical protein
MERSAPVVPCDEANDREPSLGNANVTRDPSARRGLAQAEGRARIRKRVGVQGDALCDGDGIARR